MPPCDEFFLALDKGMITEYSGSKSRNGVVIRLTLIPTDLPPNLDIHRLRTITASGEPGPEVSVTPFDLLSLRSEGAAPGHGDLGVEGTIVHRLQERARARGHILPQISLPCELPRWSKMKVAGDVLWEIRRALGA